MSLTAIFAKQEREQDVPTSRSGMPFKAGAFLANHCRCDELMNSEAGLQARGDEEIGFVFTQSSLGGVLVAATGRGICAITLGDEPEVLVQDLKRRFAKAHVKRANKEFERWVTQVVGLIDDPGVQIDLLLDIRGTSFQQRVWSALMDVPCGHTVSYIELAERIGAPQSARAVAGACAANPLAVVIPCHRVVRQDGAISGYHWGVQRKRALLRREGSEPKLDSSEEG